jgi:hypothetical protein
MDIVSTEEIARLEELLTIKKTQLHTLIDEVDELERTIRRSSAEHLLKLVEEANQTLGPVHK